MDLQFILNAISGPVRRETLHGRPHLVAPMTMIVPGVLSGSKGALYYPEEEVGRDPSIWNGIPILHRHPELPRSGRDPIIIERQGLGHVYNSHTDHEGILRGEGWFDEGRTKQIAPEIHKRLENAIKGKNREPVELSTGLFTDNQPANNGAKCPKTGRSYQFIARNYKADHLAVFTDQRGACSINDGCGVMNAEQERQLVLNETTPDLDNDDPEDDSELDYSPQSSEDRVTVAEFFVTLLHAATCAHLVHFQTRSFAAHMAMDELYKNLPGLVDALVESYQGCYGIVSYEGISGFTPPKGDPEEFVRQVVHYVKAYRHTVGPETQLQNLVDEIASDLDRAAYRTRFLS